MSEVQAGWYPDPSGDVQKLRYWDGQSWTNQYADASAFSAPEPTAPNGFAQQADYAQQQAAAYAQQAADHAAYAQAQAGAQPGSQPGNQYGEPTQSGVYAGYQGYSTQQPNRMACQGTNPLQLYPVTQTDATLRLVNFILCVISTVIGAFALIPLAWCIPMTIHAWRIYKGERPNTIAFGVCTLIFVNLIGGILLLVSTKDQ